MEAVENEKKKTMTAAYRKSLKRGTKGRRSLFSEKRKRVTKITTIS